MVGAPGGGSAVVKVVVPALLVPAVFVAVAETEDPVLGSRPVISAVPVVLVPDATEDPSDVFVTV